MHGYLLSGVAALLAVGAAGVHAVQTAGPGAKPELPAMQRVTATFDAGARQVTVRATFATDLQPARLRQTTLQVDVGTRLGAPFNGGCDAEPGVQGQLRPAGGDAALYLDARAGPQAFRQEVGARSVAVTFPWPAASAPVCLGGELEYLEGEELGDHDDVWGLQTVRFNHRGEAVAQPERAPFIEVAVDD